jgi:hypothetical protein
MTFQSMTDVSQRVFWCVLHDEGPTRLSEPVTVRPDRIAMPGLVVPLTLGHRQFSIGLVDLIVAI